MQRFHLLRQIASLLRYLEIFLLLGLLSWLLTRLPFAVRISGEFLRSLAAIIASPHFVFAVGNAIIIILVAKSGQFTRNQTNASSEAGESEMLMLSPLFRSELTLDEAPDRDPEPYPDTVTEEIVVYEDKEIICLKDMSAFAAATTETTKKQRRRRACEDEASVVLSRDGKMESDMEREKNKDEAKLLSMEKNKDEAKLLSMEKNKDEAKPLSMEKNKDEAKPLSMEKNKDEVKPLSMEKVLCRSETDAVVSRRKVASDGEESEDGLSSEEFRRTVEDFIAKQKRFRRREESQAIVVLRGQA